MEKQKFCDLFCSHASFPKSYAIDGACRREISLYCNKYKRLVPKNGLCLDFKNKKMEEK